MVKPTTITIFSTLVLTYGWLVRKLDVYNVSLNGDFEEYVYMIKLEGFIDKSKPHFLFKLKKILYELKQASRA